MKPQTSPLPIRRGVGSPPMPNRARLDLHNKSAVITGASSGISELLAQSLARA